MGFSSVSGRAKDQIYDLITVVGKPEVLGQVNVRS